MTFYLIFCRNTAFLTLHWIFHKSIAFCFSIHFSVELPIFAFYWIFRTSTDFNVLLNFRRYTNFFLRKTTIYQIFIVILPISVRTICEGSLRKKLKQKLATPYQKKSEKNRKIQQIHSPNTQSKTANQHSNQMQETKHTKSATKLLLLLLFKKSSKPRFS